MADFDTPMPDDHAELTERFKAMVASNQADGEGLAKLRFALPQPLMLLERLELLIDSAFGAMAADDLENAPYERLVFECHWQRRLHQLYVQARDQIGGPNLIVPKGTQRPNGSAN